MSLSALIDRTAIRSVKLNASCSAATVAAIPAGLCAASTMTTGLRRTISRRPGELIAATASRTRARSSGLARDPRPVQVVPGEVGARRRVRRWRRRGRRPRPRRSRRPGSRPGGRRTAAGTGRRSRRAGRGRDPLAADGQLAADHAELQALPGDRGADLGRAAEQDLRGGGRLLGDDRDGAGLDDAGLLGGDLLDRVAELATWSMEIGVITATAPSATLVLSHVPPMPTSMTATSTGASAKVAKAMPGEDLEERQPDRLAASTRSR